MPFLSAMAPRALAHRACRAALALAAACAAITASAHDARRASMLALGDSVVFGYITADGPAYVNPDNFLAYPELAGAALKLDVANASCPGETSAGLLSLTAPDNGCSPARWRLPTAPRAAATIERPARGTNG